MQAFWDLLSNLFGEVFAGIEDDLVRPGSTGELGLLFIGHGSKDMRAEGLRHLRQKKTDASRTGVDENFIARPDRTGGVGQVVSGHALEHGTGRLLKTDAIGDLYQAVGGSHSQLGIGSGYTAPGNAVAGFYLCDVCPNCHNRTSS